MNHDEAKALMDAIMEHVASSDTLDQKTFAALSALCSPILTSTLEILDSGKITKFET
jgi:hypothetical protein